MMSFEEEEEERNILAI